MDEGDARLNDLVTVSIEVHCPEQEQSATKAKIRQDVTKEIESTVKNNSEDKSGRNLCPFCVTGFARLRDLRTHVTRKHSDMPMPENLNTGKTKCFECNARFCRTTELISHLKSEHKMEFQIETLAFQNIEEFEKWKDDFEKQNQCSYTTYGSKQKGCTYQTYRCSRSGWYRTKITEDDQRQRKMKTSGTSKIGNNCTSTMKVQDKEDGTLEATINKTHYSHDVDIQHASRKVRDYNIQQGTTDYIYPEGNDRRRMHGRKRPYKRRVTPAQREEYNNIKHEIQFKLLKIQELVEGSSVNNLQNVKMLYDKLETAITVFEETNVP